MEETAPDASAAERLRRQATTLADFGLYAFRARDLDELLQHASVLVSQAIEIKLVKVLEWLPEREEFLVRAGVNWKPGVVGHATLPGGDRGSPAGHALARQEPVISPEVAAEDRFDIPDLLREHGVESMVNVPIPGEREPFGVLEVDAPRSRDYGDEDIAFLRNYANLLAAAVDRLRAHQALERTAEQRRMLTREQQHRVKNILTLVESIARLTEVEGRTAEEFREALLGRLQALGRAQALSSEQQEDMFDLGGLVKRVVEPHRADRPEAVTIEGPRVALEARQATTLGLALHELTTNAAKYGALSVPEGRVSVSWRLGEEEGARNLVLRWRESGGPPVEPPRRRGFGTTLIERAARHDLHGRTELVHAPEGVRYEVAFPLAQP